MKKTLRSLIITSNFLIICIFSFAQDPTIGLRFHNESVSDGYLLFTPENNNNVYLVDPCGQKIHQWIFTELPGATCYLLENGNLLRAGKDNIEIRDWNNNIVWSFNVGTLGCNQHHDIEPLPNGNILCVVNDTYTSAEMIAIGKDPTTVGTTLKLDKIIELQPVGLNDALVVWEWKFFDHFIQNYDNTKPNYGVIADHPELFDLNYVDADVPAQRTDYTHVNGIDYNANLDQILLCTRHLNEIHIIDHSTTTAEASGHTGGNSNLGGDILWRWGNPRIYGQGDASDQKLFLQHDAKWVETGYLDEGKISVFNNGYSGSTNSSIHLIVPEIIGGIYTKENDIFKPLDFDWSWSGSILGEVMLEGRMSGAQGLPNGNMMLCETSKGQASEISKSGDVLWVYKNPTGLNGNVYDQFETNISDNNLFRAEKYPVEYAAFAGIDLTPQGIIENVNQFSEDCFITLSIEAHDFDNLTIINPVRQNRIMFNQYLNLTMLSIVDISGRIVYTKKQFAGNTLSINLAPSLYIIKLQHDSHIELRKIIVE
ncbi:MAG: aryl-sulfate sulfotransferase [Lentimicrobium sp.]|jgi:hypothetical protein|nr:aryl-sulfate sulfotransferase [Lentimicrobium sp.]